MTRTYLHACLRDELTVRWPDNTMPIRVYLAPFHWYEKSKQQESFVYQQMVMDSLKRWSDVTDGKIRFQIVGELKQSQINITWRRVDRKSLGHCEYMINDRNMVYSAEIQIGLSDGLLHAKYNDTDEVKHTILHEIGHALGIIGHSDHSADIMYVPHQFGVVDLSKRDIETINWLYKLPVGFNYQAIGEKYQLDQKSATGDFSIHDVIEVLSGDKPQVMKDTFLEKAKPRIYQEQPEKLQQQQDILTQMGKFHIATQRVKRSSSGQFPHIESDD